MSFDLETEVPEILDRILSIWLEERRAETPIDIGAANQAYCTEVAERLETELGVRFPDSVVSARVEEGGRIIFSKNPI
jgi:hypothetical protein